jgi:phosphate starvation-inducible PhoH-like protein
VKKRHRKFDIKNNHHKLPPEDNVTDGAHKMKPSHKRSRTKRDLNNLSELLDQDDWKAARDKGFDTNQDAPEKDLLKLYKNALKAPLKPKTANQQNYFNNIDECTLTLCNGPAGTGKTYMACGIAIQQLFAGKFKKIVLTRPIVECGSNLGILPGGIDEKTDPYMAPMFDSLGDFIDHNVLTKLKDDGYIEVCPLETMRGRSFKNTFMILDEAQNTTKKQLKMFLTRIGIESKVVVCGDTTQSDLKSEPTNPLAWAWDLLNHEEIAKVTLEESDIQRHGIVRYIIETLPG